MRIQIETILGALLDLAVGILNLCPLRLRTALVLSIIRCATLVAPKYRKIGERNLCKAFPESDQAWRGNVLEQSEQALARLLVDFLRMSRLSQEEARRSFDFPFLPTFLELQASEKPIFYATGHLGSFEILAHYLAVTGFPLSMVARQFKPQWLDSWWTKRREANGNRVIPRSGALKGLLRELKAGRDVAVLFDQNVTRQHAAFIPWFGHPAATTRVIGLTALKLRPHLVVISIESQGDCRYRIHAELCDCDDIYAAPELSNDQKVDAITARLSSRYEAMIRNNPGEWFWMHRRWKTAPEGTAEEFYANL